MARNRFLVISTSFVKDPDPELVRKALDRSLDWIESFPQQWLLWTSNSPAVWYSRLKPLVKDGDHIFICEIYPDRRAGRMPTAFWSFIKKRLASDDE